jgi:hypothetical protein
MVKEAKFFKKQAMRAETAARAASDEEVTQGLLAMALGYRQQAALLKKKTAKKKPKINKRRKARPKGKTRKPKDKKPAKKARRQKHKGRKKRRS